jgi:5-methyltetrahydrofolate corrinoid/iron sulfur protein methyltransferase
MDGMMPLVKKYDADMIGLMWGPEGMPRDEHERGMLTAEILAKAAEYDIENERIWFDPIIAPLNIQQNQLIATLEYMKMLQDIAPGSKSTCGLSNSSNGVPDELRPIINRAYVIMLQRYGMVSAIVDAFDDELFAVVSGKLSQAVDVVHKIMDGESVDIAALPKQIQDYAKTARVIMGQVLFSDSWLEI